MKKIRILSVLGDLDRCNGISSYVMNYYMNLDSNKVHMDFIIGKSEACDKEFEREIKRRGGNLVCVDPIRIKTIFRDIKRIKQLMKQYSDYDIIHSHILNLGYFYLKYAKKNGIKTRILHSHTEIPKEKNILREIRNRTFSKLANKQANVRFACSEIAGKSLFGNKEFYTINNAVDIDKYLYSDDIRKKYREKLNLNDSFVIIHVGRLAEQKNQMFLLEIFKEIIKQRKNSILLLAGTGPDENTIKNRIEELELQNKVKMLGLRNDVNCLLQTSDAFVLPSLFEGNPVVAIEAQAADLKCFLSDRVSKEAKILDATKYISLDKNAQEWAEIILKDTYDLQRHNTSQEVENARFDIKTEAKKLEELYLKLVK